MNISNNTHKYDHNEPVQDVAPHRVEQRKTSNFNVFDISNHQDKIVSKNMDFRNEFHFEGNEEDLKALRGNILEMDSLHLAKTRRVAHVDKSMLESDDCESDIDDFEDDDEWQDTYEIPLKRLSSGAGRLRIHRITEEEKTVVNSEFRQRIRDTLGVDSVHLNQERLDEDCN